MEELEDVIRGTLFLTASVELVPDDAHPHAALGKRIANTVLIGTLQKYETAYGKERLESFIRSISNDELQSDSSDEDGLATAPVL